MLGHPLGLGCYLENEYKIQEDGNFLFSIVHHGVGYPVTVNVNTKKIRSYFIDGLPMRSMRSELRQQIVKIANGKMDL